MPGMEQWVPHLVVGTVALIVAALTLVTGFGLGTLLLPAFAMFFPIEIAVAATAVVHLANNLFKLALIGRWARWDIVVSFGTVSAIGAIAGAWVLARLADGGTLVEYKLIEHPCRVTVMGLVVGTLIVAFGALEFSARLDRAIIPRRWLLAGGVLSGFFGGLSGHQGALRSAFLVRAGMTKEQLVGTRAVCAVIVDLSRLLVYGLTFIGAHAATLADGNGAGLILTASLAAFVGSYFGARLVKSVTLVFIRRVVGVALLALGAAIASGIL